MDNKGNKPEGQCGQLVTQDVEQFSMKSQSARDLNCICRILFGVSEKIGIHNCSPHRSSRAKPCGCESRARRRASCVWIPSYLSAAQPPWLSGYLQDGAKKRSCCHMATDSSVPLGQYWAQRHSLCLWLLCTTSHILICIMKIKIKPCLHTGTDQCRHHEVMYPLGSARAL